MVVVVVVVLFSIYSLWCSARQHWETSWSTISQKSQQAVSQDNPGERERAETAVIMLGMLAGRWPAWRGDEQSHIYIIEHVKYVFLMASPLT